MKSDKMNVVGKMLISKKLTIAFAESATAGRLSAEFSMIDHAGEFLKGGIACYDAQLKEDLLQVNHTLIETYTPESMEVTRAISLGLSQLIPADIQIGITGLTAPGGSETKEKPIGTIFIYATNKGELAFSERFNFTGEREEIVSATVDACADLLINYLSAVD
jgi:nicotinamide-nucleotide amidase